MFLSPASLLRSPDRGRKNSKTKMNVRLTNFIKEMPQVNLPKALKNMNQRKKFNSPEYTRVKIYKSQSDAAVDALPIGEEALDRAKMFVCGGENWADKVGRLKAEHNTEGKKNAVVNAVIAKSNDDVRQEVFVMQMIHFYQSVFKNRGLAIFLKPYKILSTSNETGLIELLKDATSIDGLKKSDNYPVEKGLRGYFELAYGPPAGEDFKRAQNNFMQSLVGYSLVSYLLGLKDRHNGNIMINTKGQLIHIDFGFAFGMAPGHEWSMERAAFKLTKEYADVLDGYGSPKFEEFENLFLAGFKAARSSSQVALGLVEIMMYRSNYPCFTGFRYGGSVALTRFRERLMLHVKDEAEIDKRVRALIRNAHDHWGTNFYDHFQKWTNGLAL